MVPSSTALFLCFCSTLFSLQCVQSQILSQDGALNDMLEYLKQFEFKSQAPPQPKKAEQELQNTYRQQFFTQTANNLFKENVEEVRLQSSPTSTTATTILTEARQKPRLGESSRRKKIHISSRSQIIPETPPFVTSSTESPLSITVKVAIPKKDAQSGINEEDFKNIILTNSQQNRRLGEPSRRRKVHIASRSQTSPDTPSLVTSSTESTFSITDKIAITEKDSKSDPNEETFKNTLLTEPPQKSRLRQSSRRRKANVHIASRSQTIPETPSFVTSSPESTFSITDKVAIPEKAAESAFNEEEFKKQAESAKYHFASAVEDGINGNLHQREELRDGLAVRGKYSYSDGYYKRTVHYEADDKGYRVVKEEVEPLAGPQSNPLGRAKVSSFVHGNTVNYEITQEDLVKVTKTGSHTTSLPVVIPGGKDTRRRAQRVFN